MGIEMSSALLTLGTLAAVGIAVALSITVLASFATAFFTVYPIGWSSGRLSPPGATRFRRVSFASEDGIPLVGWYSDGAARQITIVLCHGCPGDKSDMLGLGEVLRQADFNVLALDFRRWGESGRGPVTLGYREARDILGAVRYLKESHPTQSRRVAIVGLSMGGAAALLAAAQTSEIDAVVVDSSYARLDQEAYRFLRHFWGPLTPVVYYSARWFGERLIRVTLPAVSPERAIRGIAPRPVLIIHGTYDHVIDVEDAWALFRAAGDPKALWLVDGAGHAGTRAIGGSEYDTRVVNFLTQHLDSRRSTHGDREGAYCVNRLPSGQRAS